MSTTTNLPKTAHKIKDKKGLLLIGLLLAVLAFQSVAAQHMVVKDLDGDARKDTVRLCVDNWQLEVKLSSRHFTAIRSAAGLTHADSSSTYVSGEENGFAYQVSYMRSSFSARFHYDSAAHKMRLAGLQEWNASSGRSGANNVDLDVRTGAMIIRSDVWNEQTAGSDQVDPVKMQLYFPEVYLSNFSGGLVEYFTDESARRAWDYSDQDLALADDSLQLPPGSAYTWLGSLGEHIPVFIHFQRTDQAYGRTGTLVVGQITYLKTPNRTPIPLMGYRDQAGRYRLNEYAPDGTVTGVITAQPTGQILEGSWRAPYTHKSFHLKGYNLGLQWAPADIAASPDRIFGPYHYQYSAQGPQGDVTLARLNDKQALLSMFGVTAAPARNMADGADKDTIPLPRHTQWTYNIPSGRTSDDGCKVVLRFFKNFLLVTYPEGGYACRAMFGHNATLEGLYYKTGDR